MEVTEREWETAWSSDDDNDDDDDDGDDDDEEERTHNCGNTYGNTKIM